MHAVLVTARIESGSAAEAQTQLETDIVPRVKEIPGVVSGYWTQSADREHGFAMVVFEDERAAQAAADMVPNMPRPASVTVDNVEVREVVAHV